MTRNVSAVETRRQRLSRYAGTTGSQSRTVRTRTYADVHRNQTLARPHAGQVLPVVGLGPWRATSPLRPLCTSPRLSPLAPDPRIHYSRSARRTVGGQGDSWGGNAPGTKGREAAARHLTSASLAVGSDVGSAVRAFGDCTRLTPVVLVRMQ